MSFFAILFALLIEQARPMGRGNWVHAGMRSWILWGSRNMDAGQTHLALLTWGIAVGGPVLLALAVHWLLVWTLGWTLAVLWNVLILYFTLGFRQFSHHYTGIRDALDAGDEDRARELLAQWQQVEVGDLPRREVLRHVIEYSVLAAHRHVFGVLAWYSVCAALGLGPAGAVLFRLSEFAPRYWRYKSRTQQQVASPALQRLAEAAWHVIDWLPSRMTALAFAVTGSFEDAIDGWRNHSQRFPEDNDGVILAATAGAINVRLGGASLGPESDDEQGVQPGTDGTTPGREPELAHLRVIVGLVWRTVILWMVILALMTLARLLG